LPELVPDGLPVFVAALDAAVEGGGFTFVSETLGVAFLVSALVGSAVRLDRACKGDGGSDARIGLAESSPEELVGRNIRQIPRPEINRNATIIIAVRRNALSGEPVPLR